MDCLEAMPMMPDKSVDMILTDLPYGVTNCVWDVVVPFEPLWREYKRLIKVKDDGVIALTATQPFASDLINTGRDIFRYDLIWEKSIATGYLNAKRMPLRGHEHVLIFYKKLPTYNPQRFVMPTQSFKKYNTRGRQSDVYGSYDPCVSTGTKDFSRLPRSVFNIKSDATFFDSTKSGQRLHPTQKPVALFEYLILTYTNQGDTVLDNCAGSGTVAIASIATGRKAICIEKQKEYCDVSRRRIEEYTTQGMLFTEGTGP